MVGGTNGARNLVRVKGSEKKGLQRARRNGKETAN